VFVLNSAGEVLLIRRKDNELWALPGGCQDLGETPAECARRECLEETGFDVRVTSVLGVFSSTRYPYVHYKWKDNEFTHVRLPPSPIRRARGAYPSGLSQLSRRCVRDSLRVVA